LPKEDNSDGRHAIPILINRICDCIDLCYRQFSTMPNFIPAQNLRRQFFSLLLGMMIALTGGVSVGGQSKSWSERAANRAIALWPDAPSGQSGGTSLRHDGFALLLNGVGAAWYNTADGTYYRFEKQKVDTFLATSGGPGSGMAMARPVLLVARVTEDAKYFKVAALLDQSLFARSQAFAPQGSPAEIYESAPFFAEYAQVLQRLEDFARITKLFSEDERGKETWTDEKGRPSTASAIAMGWYMAALVDTLPYYRHGDPGRELLLQILNRTAAKVVRAQDRSNGFWHASLDRSGGPDDAMATCIFTYALQKAARRGYLDQRYSGNATRAWQGTLAHFVTSNDAASVTLLGPEEAARSGAFLLAATEMEHAQQSMLARGQVVMQDAWFNSQQRVNDAGVKERFHYKWDDYSDSGYSLFGKMFANHGAELATLPAAPTVENLSAAQYYIIVSPDIPAKNPAPHYVQAKDAEQVAEWVRRGGVLVLMENDPPNADIEHLNLLADRFGIHFNPVLSHHVVGDDFAAGQITVKGGGPIFRHPHTLYMKDTCTLSLKAPVLPLLTDKGGIIMAMAKFGKGTVVAVVDPWLYNEYTDGRKKLPTEDNYAAGIEFVEWLISQRPGGSSESATKNRAAKEAQ
jgi:unsaturated rhamnogalacturonyl hydrolase